jgi:CBS domain-containing protein
MLSRACARFVSVSAAASAAGAGSSRTGAQFVRDVMSRSPQLLKPSDTLRRAAQVMAERDVGVLPVGGQDDRIIGMLTDRDIVVRGLARGGGNVDQPVEQAMSSSDHVLYCYDDDRLESVAKNMAEQQVGGCLQLG